MGLFDRDDQINHFMPAYAYLRNESELDYSFIVDDQEGILTVESIELNNNSAAANSNIFHISQIGYSSYENGKLPLNRLLTDETYTYSLYLDHDTFDYASIDTGTLHIRASYRNGSTVLYSQPITTELTWRGADFIPKIVMVEWITTSTFRLNWDTNISGIEIAGPNNTSNAIFLDNLDEFWGRKITLRTKKFEKRKSSILAKTK